jgi:hypothetical protein
MKQAAIKVKKNLFVKWIALSSDIMSKILQRDNCHSPLLQLQLEEKSSLS